MCLWTTAQPAVANYVHALVHDQGAAKDVLQETALVLFRRFPEYDGTRPFVAWALGIARFQVMGLRRNEARNLVVFDNEVLEKFTKTWAELAPTVSDREAWLQACLARLAAHARTVLQLRYVEGFSAEEIAKRLGANGPAVRVTLQRIREQLRTCIERQRRREGEIA